MGQDFGQDCEWSEERELEWHSLSDDNHRGMHDYMKDLQELYVKYPALHEIDNDWAGFEWINADDKENSVYSYIRHSSSGKNSILVILNMTPIERQNYKIGVPKKKKYKVLLNADDKKYGGQGNEMPTEFTASAKPCDGKDYSISLNLPPYGALMLVY
jgi:1,4-alpha-glucan branching enzyme